MSKIAIQLSDDRSIIGYASESTAEAQSKYESWTLVASNPVFSIDNMYSWTVRESDNTLVHISTMLTPEEESHKSAKELTDIILANSTDIEDIKKSVMLLTNMQLNATTGGN
ncbi:hypothetical protein [Companilactobacillus sp. HBUAS59699]|uniref:hypothetical protein n=1 Tax=Companilactobacillus sp. HBUAS59699 TaxID=3109358 RepID=UPI002FEECF61